MKENKIISCVMIIITLISLILTLCLHYQILTLDDDEFWGNVFLSLFGSGFVGVISGIIYYNIKKSELIRDYTLEARKIADNVRNTVHHRGEMYPDGIIVDMIAHDEVIVFGLDEEADEKESRKVERAFQYFVRDWSQKKMAHGPDMKKAFNVCRNSYAETWENILREYSLCSQIDLSVLQNIYDQFDFVLYGRKQEKLAQINAKITRLIENFKMITEIRSKETNGVLHSRTLTVALQLYHELFMEESRGFTHKFCTDIYNLIEEVYGKTANIKISVEYTF